MSDTFVVDTREIAQSIKGRKPPYICPVCNKSYRSATGILYHVGQVGPSTKVPRCMLGEESSHGSPAPKSAPASPGGTPGSVRRRTVRKELTWAEAQRLVEVEFENAFKRIEIDNDLDISLHSEEEGEDLCDGGCPSTTPRTVHKRGRGSKGDTPNRGKSTLKSKNKAKRKSKLKTPGKDDGPIPLPKVDVTVLDLTDCQDAPPRESSYFRFVAPTTEDLDEMIEYDIDEEDSHWLSLLNEERRGQGHTVVPQDVFELLMDRLEKECCFESHTLGDGGQPFKNMYNIDENAVCCICNDGECHNTNAILFCDMCNLAVHQECYGVPYIPEGQWLCRRCLQSPSRSVDCALCPNKGGAFKQTIDGRWAHVICAIWIPEVQFSNPVFLEPIDGINEIPSARWKLTCYICRKRMGACIQCAKANCYVAFHVTCAQHASLHMKVNMGKSGEIAKAAFCDTHTPPAIKRKLQKAKLEQGNDVSSSCSESGKEEEAAEGTKEGSDKEDVGKSGKGKQESKAIKKARKKLEERRSSMVPIVNIPYVPQHRLERISSQISLHKKSQFIPRLVSYWKLKRQSRNGVPLLRRLQALNKGQRASTVNLTEEERIVLAEQLSLWNTLRQDLERARMLVELVRKREKLKREQLRFLQMISVLQLRPLNVVQKRALDRLGRKDPADIFAEPVSIDEVPDYLDVIKHPMDFSTMRKKVEANKYATFDSFEEDFQYVWRNATIYNQKDTIYYRAAIRIKEAGAIILTNCREQLRSAGVNKKSGLHDPDVQEPAPLTPNTIAQVINEPMDILDENDTDDLSAALGLRSRHLSSASCSLDEQVEILQEKLEMVQTQLSGYHKKVREKALKRELQSLRRQQKSKTRKARNSDSDDNQPNSPRKHRPPSIPRNAEELACHLLQGSLRMTASRQQILSHSGIRLEERAKEEREKEEERLKQPHSDIDHDKPLEEVVFDEAACLFSDDNLDLNESSSDYEPDLDTKPLKNVCKRSKFKGENLNHSREESTSQLKSSSTSKLPRRRHSQREGRSPLIPIEKSKSDTYISKFKTKEANFTHHLHKKNTLPPTQNGSTRSRGAGRSTKTVWRRNDSLKDNQTRRSYRQKSRQRLNSSGAYCTSASEVEPEIAVNGFNPVSPSALLAPPTTTTVSNVPHSPSRNSNSKRVTDRILNTRTSGRSNSSSQYETAGEGYSSEDKRALSPYSDVNRFSSIPSASSVEDLTVFDPLATRKEKMGRETGKKRKGSFRHDDETHKKIHLTSESSDTGSVTNELKSRPLNGMSTNGGQYKIRPLDLVWAKCRGYPSYPALVIDPDIPKGGLSIHGEKIQAPSDEVMELQHKSSTATYLVRFFDGRRTWQWLPAEKIEPLGVSSDYDIHKVAHSGHSKRSVREAYNRAKQYQKRVARNTTTSVSDSKSHPPDTGQDTQSLDKEISTANVD